VARTSASVQQGRPPVSAGSDRTAVWCAGTAHLGISRRAGVPPGARSCLFASWAISKGNRTETPAPQEVTRKLHARAPRNRNGWAEEAAGCCGSGVDLVSGRAPSEFLKGNLEGYTFINFSNF
jgi:hypothetical protein